MKFVWWNRMNKLQKAVLIAYGITSVLLAIWSIAMGLAVFDLIDGMIVQILAFLILASGAVANVLVIVTLR